VIIRDGTLRHERQRPPHALAHRDHHAALAGLVPLEATVLAVFLAVLRANVTSEKRAINLDMACQNFARVDFLRHRFAQLVRQHESRLVLAVLRCP